MDATMLPHGGFPSMVSSDQLMISGGTFIQNISDRPSIHVHSRVRTSIDILTDAVAYSAFHDSAKSFDTPKCHENTRVAITKRIMDWITGQDLETQLKYLFWLTGAAGAGKSAIVHKIVQLCIQGGIPVVSFFFNRADATRNSEIHLISTLSYQLTLFAPTARSAICLAIDKDPLIFKKSLDYQFETLIAKPLQLQAHSGAHYLFVIDGLDECIDREKQVLILDMAHKATHKFDLPIYFLIASRPEHEIKAVLNAHSMANVLTRLVLDDDYQSHKDIQIFLTDSFRQIKEDHPFKDYIPQSWPAVEDVNAIVHKSSGQFIYAKTVLRFVQSLRHLPHQRLYIALHLRAERGDLPFSELDCLYMTILSSVANIDKVLPILGFCVMASNWNSLLVDTIMVIFSLDPGELEGLFCDLHSLIALSSRVRFLHLSLHDFLLDQARSKEYFIDAAVYLPVQFCKIIDALTFESGLDSTTELLYLFEYYSQNIHISKEIINVLYSFPLEKFLDKSVKRYDDFLSRTATKAFILSFFGILNKIVQEDTNLAYVEEKHRQALDTFYISRLNTYDFETQKTELITFLTILCAAGDDFLVPITRVPTGISDFSKEPALLERYWELVPGTFSKIRPFKRPLNVFSQYVSGDYEDHYCRHIVGFLRDPVRSQKYGIGPKSYTTAAIYCIQALHTRALSQHGKVETPRVYVHVLANGDSEWRSDFSVNISGHATFILSGYVLYLLPRAAKNEQLIDLCRTTATPDFGDMSDYFPDRYFLVMEALSAYIERVEPSGSY